MNSTKIVLSLFIKGRVKFISFPPELPNALYLLNIHKLNHTKTFPIYTNQNISCDHYRLGIIKLVIE